MREYCFDCRRKRPKLIPVIKTLKDGMRGVCPRCWRKNWKKWMEETSKFVRV